MPAAEAAGTARISETGKRVIDYYIERMPIEDVIIQMNGGTNTRKRGTTTDDASTGSFGKMYSGRDYWFFR